MKKEIEKLKKQIENLKVEYNLRLSHIEKRIEELEQRSAEVAIPQQGKIPSPPDIPPLSGETEAVVKRKLFEPVTAAFTAAVAVKPDKKDETSPKKKSSPKKEIPSSVKRGAGFLGEVAASLLGPLGSLFSKATSLYSHYKSQGKLPILFLTTAGIIAMVLGFGFILQYSFTNLLNETAKVILGFITSIGIIVLGIIINNRREAYREYGSSLIGLGTILVYLSIYFAASHYRFIPAPIGFAAICANTIAAYFLAMKYETKIVSLVSFLGGAFVPFVLATYGRSEVFYFSFLLVLAGSSIYLSRKISWPSFVHITFLTSAAILEYTIFTRDPREDLLFLRAIIHIFTYIYTYHALFHSLRLKKSLVKNDILILAGGVTLLLVNIFAIAPEPETAGYIYLANGLVFFFAAIFPFIKKEKIIRATLLVTGGILAGLAIPAIFSFKLMALFWIQEAFLLLILGFSYRLPSVRKEALAVALVAAVQTVLNLGDIAGTWQDPFLRWITGEGMMNLLALGILLGLFSWTYWRNRETCDTVDLYARRIVNESISFYGLSLLLITAFYFLPSFGAAFALAAMPVLIIRGRKKNLRATEVMGFISYVIILLQVISSVILLTTLVPEVYSLYRHHRFLLVILHLAVTGFLLTGSNIIFLKLKETTVQQEKVVLLNNELISTWALGTFALGAVYFLPSYWWYLLLAAIPFLVIRGKRKNLQLTRIYPWIIYSIFLLFISLEALSLTEQLPSYGTPFMEIAASKGVLFLLLSGISLGAMIVIFHRINNDLVSAERKVPWINNELFSIWILGAFMTAAYFIHEPFMFGMALIPMPFLMIRSARGNLPFTMALAFAAYGLIMVQAGISIIETGSFDFQEQTIYGKLAMGEILILLWLYQWFFQWQMPNHPLIKYMKRARLFFYLILPVLFIPHVIKYYDELLPVALWGSVALSVILYEIVKEKLLLKEVFVLAALSSLVTFLHLLFVPWNVYRWEPETGAVTGFILLMGITLWKGGFKEYDETNEYSPLFIISFMYPAGAAFGLTVFFTGFYHLALQVTGIYAMSMFLLRRKLLPVMRYHRIYYRAGQTAIILGLVLDILMTGNGYTSGLPVATGINIGAFIILLLATFWDRETSHETSLPFIIDQYIFHITTMTIYMTLIKKYTGVWLGPATTIIVVGHAIAIMFYGTVKGLKKLTPLYGVLFAISIGKIILYDLKDFSLVEKVIAFTLIGTGMLGTAYLLQRYLAKKE